MIQKTTQEYILQYKYFYLFAVQVVLLELAGVAGRTESQPWKCFKKVLNRSSLESSCAYLAN